MSSNKKKMNNKGNITLYLVFFTFSIVLIAIAAVIVPVGTRFNIEMYEASEQLFLDANSSIADINNQEVKDRIYSMVDNSLGATENNIDILTTMYQYSWLIIILLVGLVLFLFQRQIVELQGGGGFI